MGRVNYYEYMASREWAIIRQKIRDRANGKCERCGQKVNRIQVHHLTYERLGCERLTDLLGACADCHKYLSAKSDFDPKAVMSEPLIVEFLKLIRSDIEAHRTENGGFTREYLASIGVPWPPPKGWKKRLEKGI